jgi:hypothetical protein
VCRDGSATYAEAFCKALPEAVQVTDRCCPGRRGRRGGGRWCSASTGFDSEDRRGLASSPGGRVRHTPHAKVSQSQGPARPGYPGTRR